MRMLMNNLDPEVAEHPDQLIVYGGSGRAARSWDAYAAIIRTLQDLENDETLLVQSGKPVGVMRTHEWAPRVLIANSNLVPQWATWEEFRRLEQLGPMYGQMTAGSWIYIGTQGIPAGHLRDLRGHRGQTLRRHAQRHDHADRRPGRHGGRPAAGRDHERRRGHLRRLRPVPDLPPDRVRLPRRAGRRYQRRGKKSHRRPRQGRGAVDRPARQRRRRLPQLLKPHAPIDIVTDQTSAHDPLTYLPRGVAFEDMAALRAEDPAGFTARARDSMAEQVSAMVGFLDAGAEVFDYGNSIRGEAQLAGYDRAFEFPGFVPAYIRPLFCEGRGPFRWAALSGDPNDIAATDRAILDLFPQNEALARWIRLAEEKVHFQGLPARICWLGYGERHLAGLRFNDMVKSGELKAPIVLGRDHLDCGSVASPYRETEAMADGSDAIADWPLLNALVNTASGASWVSIHHGGGVGIGRSIHAGQVCVADGTDQAGQKLERVLTNDPAMGVIRHADAGYELASTVAVQRGVRVPMAEG